MHLEERVCFACFGKSSVSCHPFLELAHAFVFHQRFAKKQEFTKTIKNVFFF